MKFYADRRPLTPCQANGQDLDLSSVTQRRMRLCLFLIVILNGGESRLQCKNADNEAVDWYVVYKLPMDPTSSNNLIKKGVGFTFITSDDLDKGWTLGKQSINASNTLIGYTLQPLYGEEKYKNFLWMMYNDETPNKTVSFELGHTKGTVFTDNEEGLWLIHSVPRFPPLPSSKYGYPKSGTRYGQSFLCISLLSSEVDKIGIQFKYNEPQIYSSFVPLQYEKLYPDLVSAMSGSWVKSPPWNNLLQFSSAGGMQFHSFAKSKQFNKDLYADWIAPSLEGDLVVETWPNGHGRLPSSCENNFKVYNVESISFQSLKLTFSNHVDHSKWSITLNSSDPWICIGDINRMESQEKRSGGSVCMKQPRIWSAYKQSVNDIEPCTH